MEFNLGEFLNSQNPLFVVISAKAGTQQCQVLVDSCRHGDDTSDAMIAGFSGCPSAVNWTGSVVRTKIRRVDDPRRMVRSIVGNFIG